MTAAEWFAADSPGPLLRAMNLPPTAANYGRVPPLPPKVARRYRLFGCACARMVWDLLPTDARSAVVTRERFADGLATKTDLRAAAFEPPYLAITPQQHALGAAGDDPVSAANSAAKALATQASGPAPHRHTRKMDAWHRRWNAAYDAARLTQAHYVRDIFPPPGYAPALDAAWRTSTVLALAMQMDASGDFSAVPILADALQDAGCDDETALRCCRVPGAVHVRGNWVVDLVLGREWGNIPASPAPAGLP